MTRPTHLSRWSRPAALALTAFATVAIALTAAADDAPATAPASNSTPVAANAGDRFRESVEPVLEEHCLGCHGNGIKKGGVSLDGFADDADLVGRRELWWNVLKNVR